MKKLVVATNNAHKLSEIRVIIGVTCSVHTRTSTEHCYFKARIIGEAIDTIFLINVTCFLKGVALKGFGGFRNVVVTVDVGKGEQLYLVANNDTDFRQFMCIVGRNN